MSLVAAFTGHRPDKLGGMYAAVNPRRDRIFARLKDAITSNAVTHGIIGMARGVDQWAGCACVTLQIPFTAAIPFTGQEKCWTPAEQKEYHDLLAWANKIEVVAQDDTVNAYHARNRWMVLHSDLLIAVFDGSPGGTAHCVKYAAGVGRRILFVDPS